MRELDGAGPRLEKGGLRLRLGQGIAAPPGSWT